MYERSYMHKDIVTHIFTSYPTQFFITISIDGYLKFWKKNNQSKKTKGKGI